MLVQSEISADIRAVHYYHAREGEVSGKSYLAEGWAFSSYGGNLETSEPFELGTHTSGRIVAFVLVTL